MIGFFERRLVARVGFYGPASGEFPNDGAFHHIAATYDVADLTLFVDGVQVGQAEPGFPLFWDDTPIIIGAQQNSTAAVQDGFRGVVDELRLYAVPLTKEEIRADMTQ